MSVPRCHRRQESQGRASTMPEDLRPGLPLLYSFRRCPYAMRARMALAVSATPHAVCEVSLRDKPPELLAASPKGTVPVLVLPSGEVIDESLNIMLWALEGHDPERWLGNGADLQDMQTLIAQCDGPFKRQLDAYKYPHRQLAEARTVTQTGVRSAARTDAEVGAGAQVETAELQILARQQASVFLDALNQRLTHAGFLWGDQRSLADVAIVPFVRQFAGVQPAWFAQAPWPALRAWLDRITASTMFTGIMQQQKLKN